MNTYEELKARGLIAQVTDEELIKDLINKFHPSTIINNKSLKGREIIAGGSINIPIDINALDTTKSINKNGKYIKNPI